MTWFRMSDRPADDKPAIEITREEARRWNTPELGFGIFATVNSFNGPRRKDCLARINAWAVDMDEGTKEQQARRLLGAPLVPSLIIETKRGYQAYWIAKDGKAEHWNAIVLERLVPYFGADKNARDICRILRVPGFLHLKDPSDPFLIRIAWKHPVSYSERQVAAAFAWVPDPKAVKHAEDEERRSTERQQRELARKHAAESGAAYTETFWEAVFNLDCEEGLRRLSGHWAVGGEKYDFRRTGRGNLNIFVNGASSPCFIDGAKRIGSPSDGGPTLAQWLRWFKHDWKTVVAILKELFPQLDEVDRAAREQQRRSA